MIELRGFRYITDRHSGVTSQLLFLFVLLTAGLMLSAQDSFAAPSPAGKLVDASAVEGDSNLVCASYEHKKKVTTYLFRIDGAKHLGKSNWTKKSINSQISTLNKTIKRLKPLKDKKSKKELKKAKKKKNDFAAAKIAIGACDSGANNQQAALVEYSHVEQLIQNSCLNCHGPLGWTAPSGTSMKEFLISTGRVVPGNLEASPFYTFISNNPEGYQPAYMPKGAPPLSDIKIWLLGRWILDMASENPGAPATPTPGGTAGLGRQEYNQYCSSCHGLIDVSSKWGKSAAQIQAAIGSNPQMLHLSGLSSEQIQRIALALSTVQPPLEGTVSVSNVASVLEGNDGQNPVIQFKVTFTGTASQPFTVGFATSSGTALADSDFEFQAGTLQFQGTNGETKTISIQIIGDNFQENHESLFVDIGGVSYGGVRVNVSTASGIILNDDALSLINGPQPGKVRLAYGLNQDFSDAVGLSDGTPMGSIAISSLAHTGAGAAILDGIGDYISAPGSNLSNMTDFTIAGWVYWENSSSTTTRVFDFGSSTSNYLYFSPRDSAGRMRFEMRGTGSATYTLQGPLNSPLASAQWVHVAVTYSSATAEMKIFVNGAQAASRNAVNPPAPATSMMSVLIQNDNRVGQSRAAGSNGFQGRIDEVIVWDAALNQTEVAEAMNLSQSITPNSSLDVRFSNGQPLANGASIDFGSAATGSDSTIALFIQNNGPGGLGFASPTSALVLGEDKDDFSVVVQPMPWQQLLGVGSLTSIALRYSPKLPGAKTATLAISNSDLLNGNFAAGIEAEATGEAVSSGDTGMSGDEDPNLVQGRLEYAINCASCHGALASSQKLGTTVSAVTAALNPSSGVPQMTSLGLSTEQIARIVLALNSPLPEPAESPIVGDSIINVGTAPYVVESLKDIFLPPGDPAAFTGGNLAVWTIITEGIFGVRVNGTFISNRVMFFNRRRERFDSAFQNEELNNTLRPAPDTIRSGLLKRACDLITENDTAVSNALGKIGLTTSSALTPQAVKDLYEKLFAPGRQMPQYLADVISTFPNQAPGFDNPNIDKFRYVINYLCVSGVAEGI